MELTPCGPSLALDPVHPRCSARLRASSDLMHGVEDILPLDLDGEAALGALVLQQGGKDGEGELAGGDVHQHGHGEKLPQDGLADVQDIDVVLGQQGAHGGDDAHLVLADDSNNGFHSLESFPYI